MSLISLTDLRDAARGLRRAPTIALSAITCLALGLAVTADVFSAVSRVLLQPLPFHESERLVTIYRTTPHFNTGPHSPGNFEDLARDARRVSGIAASLGSGAFLEIGHEPARVQAMLVSGEFFGTLGVQPLMGRLLTAADAESGAAPAVVITEELWRTQLGADPRVVGTTVPVDGVAHTVVGVLPRDFRVPTGFQIAQGDLWLPLQFTSAQREDRLSNSLQLIGRLAPGATNATAQEELTRLFDGIVTRYPALKGEGLRVVSLREESARAVRSPILLLFGAVLVVLLIAATNVSSLLLARSVQRRRETAVRVALGGTRWAVMRPILTESVLLTVIGLALGAALAWAGLRVIGSLAASRLPQVAGLSLDWRVIAFTVALSLTVAVLCGVVPAWRGSSVDPQDALRGGRGGGQDRSQRGLLNALVVAEVSLSLVLLLNAGLVLKGFTTLLEQDPGFEARGMLTLQTSVSPQRYPDETAIRRFLEPAITAIEGIPGVASAGAINLMPYDNWGWNSNVRYEGQPGDDQRNLPLVEARLASPGFFAATGQRLLAGRLLTASDDNREGAARVVVANKALVDRDFKGADPIGKRFHLSDTAFATIVGVVSDIRNFGPFSEPRPEFYFTWQQMGGSATSFPIMVRARGGDVQSLVAPVRAALRAVDPQVVITRVQPMPQLIGSSVGRPRFYLTLIGVFAVVAVVLALAGVYGVMNYAVTQRTREFGIRSALGSTPSATIARVAREGMTLIAIGLGLGIIASFSVTRAIQSLLYGVSPLDLTTWVAATLLLALAGLLATLVPARRSARVNPLVAIRTE